MSASERETIVDARGLRCPWPVLRLARAMRDQGGRGRVRIRADDPAAEREITALAGEHGWRVERPDRTACDLIVSA